MSKIETDPSTATPEAKIGGPVTIENPDLILALMEQSSRDLAFTTNSLIESYKAQAETAEAELAAVRWKIETLLSGEYAPSHLALLRGLYPSKAMIESFMHTEESA